jgi:hypothetical protein
MNIQKTWEKMLFLDESAIICSRHMPLTCTLEVNFAVINNKRRHLTLWTRGKYSTPFQVIGLPATIHNKHPSLLD